MKTQIAPTRFVGYVRVSTDKQDISPDLQAAEIERYAAAKGLTLTTITREEASAKSIHTRPLFADLVRQAQQDPSLGIVVYKLDRVSRNNEDWFGPLNNLAQAGKLDIVATPVEVGNEDNEAFLGMQSIFSNLERRKIGTRTRQALQFKIAQGGTTGRPPYGFEFTGTKGRRALRPNPETHHWFLLAHYLVFIGVPFARIARLLTIVEAPTRSGNETWHGSAICSMTTCKATGFFGDIEAWKNPDLPRKETRDALYREVTDAFRRAGVPFEPVYHLAERARKHRLPPAVVSESIHPT